MKKKDTLNFYWPKTGHLKVGFKNSHSATLRFTPSLAAILEGLAIAEERGKAKEKDRGIT